MTTVNSADKMQGLAFKARSWQKRKLPNTRYNGQIVLPQKFKPLKDEISWGRKGITANVFSGPGRKITSAIL